MPYIHILDEPTINQIAAGEVVERPSAVIKELVENSVDAGATAITVQIKEGGISFIRVTDNGAGMDMADIPLAFLRHSTSKINAVTDLLNITSLGFRGEALSSIASVSQIELITKKPSSLNGCRYVIEGGVQKSIEEIGCPSGTTFIMRNLFYNTPARKKFLKSVITEAGYISDLMERLIISHPGISFKYIVNNLVKLQSTGNNNIKDILYNIYGKNIIRELIPVDYYSEDIKISGLIGKPVTNRGNRHFENYFVNGRYVKNNIITKAIEESYKPYLMKHKFPFTSIFYEINPSLIDINVHPQKTEIRLKNNDEIYNLTYDTINKALSGNEMIPKIILTKYDNTHDPSTTQKLAEPFEENRRISELGAEASVKTDKPLENEAVKNTIDNYEQKSDCENHFDELTNNDSLVNNQIVYNDIEKNLNVSEQLSMFSDDKSPLDQQFLSEKSLDQHNIIGQVFSTYWLVEYNNELFIIDQHAASEKVLYEKIMATAKTKTYASQLLLPPIVLSLTLREQQVLNKHEEVLNKIGYEFEHFGGNEYSVRSVPSVIYGLSEKELILEFLDELWQDLAVTNTSTTSILEKTASLACKSAIKAKQTLSKDEVKELIKELLALDNPYNCPHGRPVIISMSLYELEKKFKRIV